MPSFQRLLVTTDGSRLSAKAVRTAIDLAAAVGGELVVLHVVPRYPTSYFEGGVDVTHTDIARIEKSWNDEGQALLDGVKERATAAGVQVRTALGHSDRVAEAVVAAARKHKCDMIVMASHGRRGLSRVLLGSETQHVLANATVPVLVLR